MSHPVTISGETVSLVWSKASSRLMRLRLAGIGFDWSKDTVGSRMSATMVKICWALLPSEVFEKYADYESMYSAMNEDEDAPMFKAVSAIISEMSPPAEKKSTSKKSRSPASNSG